MGITVPNMGNIEFDIELIESFPDFSMSKNDCAAFAATAVNTDAPKVPKRFFRN